ncbi:POU class 2 homeobox associating-factor 2-like [Aplochiton taeniatus]
MTPSTLERRSSAAESGESQEAATAPSWESSRTLIQTSSSDPSAARDFKVHLTCQVKSTAFSVGPFVAERLTSRIISSSSTARYSEPKNKSSKPHHPCCECTAMTHFKLNCNNDLLLNIQKSFAPRCGSFAEYSKRVYQGVRVKHTVKDLLAERRSGQNYTPRFNAGTSHSQSQSAFVQMSGSHMLPGYYSMCKPFLTDTELNGTKQYPADPYSAPMGSTGLPHDQASAYPSLMDSYHPLESYGDYRGASGFPTGGGCLFPTLPHSLSLFPGDASHMLLRDSWEQAEGDSANQRETLGSERAAPSVTSDLATHDPRSPSPYRDESSLSSSQSYSLQPLDEVRYHGASYGLSPSYSSTYPYMTAPTGYPAEIKLMGVPTVSYEAGAFGSASPWAKDDAPGPWIPSEPRKVY